MSDDRYAPRPHWPDANCLGRTGDMAMPILAELEDRYVRSAAHRHVAAAKSICAGCPRLAECRRWALTRPDPCLGLIAGGLTPTERSAWNGGG